MWRRSNVPFPPLLFLGPHRTLYPLPSFIHRNEILPTILEREESARLERDEREGTEGLSGGYGCTRSRGE